MAIDEKARRIAEAARDVFRIKNMHCNTQDEADLVFLQAYESSRQQPQSPVDVRIKIAAIIDCYNLFSDDPYVFADKIIEAILPCLSPVTLQAEPHNFTSAPVTQGDSKREAYDGDWLNDTTHENGNYANKCCECGLIFNGRKGRIVCKYCVDKKAAESRHTEPQPDEVERVALNIAKLDNTVFRNTPENCKIIAEYAIAGMK